MLWVALVVITVGLALAPLWIGPVPPLTDFGGHLGLAHAWIGLDDVPIYGAQFRRLPGWMPNLVAVRFAALLHPLVTPLTSLRLFFSLAVVASVAMCQLWLNLTGRSRWQLLFCVPLTWGTMLALGLVNYVMVIPCILAAAAAGHLAGKHDRWRHGLALGAICLFGYALHGLGYLFVVTLGVAMLLLSQRRPRALCQLVFVAPSLGLWVAWFLLRSPAVGGPRALAAYSVHISMFERVRQLGRHTHDALFGYVDTAFAALLACVWVAAVAFVLWRRRESGTSAAPTSAVMTPAWRGRLARALAALHRRPLFTLIAVVGLLYWVLPYRIGEVAIGYRLVTPFALLLSLAPIFPTERSARAFGLVAFFVSSAWLGAIGYQTQAFAEDESGPLAPLIAELPEGARVACLGTFDVRVRFRYPSWSHGCPGWVFSRDAYSRLDFAHTTYNAIRYKPGVWEPEPERQLGRMNAALMKWEYLIVRGRMDLAPHLPLELVARQPAEGDPKWTLYRIPSPPALRGEAPPMEGGRGGHDIGWRCTEGHSVQRLWVERLNGVRGVALGCRSDPGAPPTRIALRGPVLGRAAPRRSVVSCPRGSWAVGIHGRKGGTVNALGLLCDGEPSVRGPQPHRTRAVGRERGATFERRCDEGERLVGLWARVGARLDATAPVCEPMPEELLGAR